MLPRGICSPGIESQQCRVSQALLISDFLHCHGL